MSEALFPETDAGAAQHIWHPSRQQAAFRHLMSAFSYPGRVVTVAGGAESALMLVLATLVDTACALADPQHLLKGDDLRRLGVRATSTDAADFVLADGRQLLETTPRLGSLENPERGATLVLRVTALGAGVRLILTGPGIQQDKPLQVSGIDPAWWTLRAQWNEHFPLGVDLILVSERDIAVVPRTTRIDLKGAH